MIDRYSRPKMKEIWSDENRFKKWLEVELAVLEAQAELEEIEQEVVDEVKQKASFTVEEIRKAEEETHHEMVAFINVIQSKISDEAKRWFHFGLTSSDIMDTALAGRKLSRDEMLALFEQLSACEQPFRCPHGRPTIIKFTKSEFEKMFGRHG